ncbi:MAG: hypothetical protein WBG10_07400 [Pseudolabrys sp.]
MPVIACRLGAVIAFALMLVVSAQAQAVLHGRESPPGEAVPANGTFSIRFPISYKEVEYQGIETKSADPKEAASAVHMLTGVDSDGLRFSATEQPLRLPMPPIDSFMETAKRRFEAVASDVQHQQKDGLEILSFTLSEPKQEYFFQVMRGKTSGYVLAVQFPAELRGKASGMKDDFFSSFKIVRQ